MTKGSTKTANVKKSLTEPSMSVENVVNIIASVDTARAWLKHFYVQ